MSNINDILEFDDDDDDLEIDIDNKIVIPQVKHINRYYIQHQKQEENASILWCVKDCFLYIHKFFTNCITCIGDTCFGFDNEYYN